MYKILVVDDNVQNRMFIIETLRTVLDKYEVWVAPNGKTVFEKILIKERPDLILLDWEMPGMNGLEILKELKKRKEFRSIPIIMYVGLSTSPKSLEQFIQYGIVEILRKPVQPLELELRLKNTLKLQTQEQQLLKLSHQLIRYQDFLSNLILSSQ